MADDSSSSNSDSDDEPVISFADRILEFQVESEFDRDGRKFFPEKSLDRLLTDQCIRDELAIGLETLKPKSTIRNMSSEELDKLIAYIRTRAKKIFAIIAYIGWPPRAVMKGLMDGVFDDSFLPIEENLKNAQQPHLLTLISKPKGYWTGARITKFYDEQWKFLAPVFFIKAEENDADRVFQKPRIMPFTKRYDDGTNVSEGAFGQVSKYEIHPWHLLDPANPVSGRSLHFLPGEVCSRPRRRSLGRTLSLSRRLKRTP